jgi:squalene-hopene/tetraprenyl-beta-curcumene cyclase
VAVLCVVLPVVAQDPPEIGERIDDRIDPSRITEYDPPPLPEQVILPKPPDFRIATDPSQVPIDREVFERAQASIRAGLAYLESQQGTTRDGRRGAWMTRAGAAPSDTDVDKPTPVAIAVTAMVVKAFVQADPSVVEDRENIRLAVNVLLAARQEDGSFAEGPMSNYITSLVVAALSTIDRRRFDSEVEDGVAWLVDAQWDEDEGLDPRQDWYGGAGYGNRGRPDLSNMQTMLDALYESGMSPDEPAFQKATQFVSKTQNLKSTNNAPWAGNDGGFVYTPANNGESMGSEYAGDGRYGEHIPEGQFRSLRSYGSMTYAGFKSMLYAGLSPDDERVRAAFDWVRRHWTFDENPGLGQQGLFYYYLTMSRALTVGQQTHIADAKGVKHNWREELINAIAVRQKGDGSWRNETDRWLEGESVLATAYAVLALQEAIKPVLAHSIDEQE